MKIAIVYRSITGNTKLIAEAIKEELKDKEVVYFGEPTESIDADFIFLGSWTDKGMCCKEIRDFCQTLSNKKIAYFGTAGFGGSEEYYKSLYNRVKEIIPSNNTVVDYFFCQGKMPMAVRDRYIKLITEHPEDSNLKVSIENFDKALSHPDTTDLENAKLWSRKLTK
nr:flavodoxin family protein BilS [uncultured Anaerosporobacter sp.]